MTASADDQDDETDGPRPVNTGEFGPSDPAVRQLLQSQQWTISSNWRGDEWVGDGLPPWGTRPRCQRVTNGRRCRKAIIPGGTTVCSAHGGAAPQVRRRAQLRLLSLVDPAVSVLARILTTSTDEKLKAHVAQDILNRTGMGKAQDVSADVAKAVMMERYYAMRDAAVIAREEAGLPPIGAELELPAFEEEQPGEREELESLPASNEMTELVQPEVYENSYGLDEMDYSDSYSPGAAGGQIITMTAHAAVQAGNVSANVARARAAAANRVLTEMS